MNIDDRSQVYQALLGRRDAIADSWYQAIAQTSFAPHSAAEVRQHLVELTEEAIALLLTEPFDHGRAEAMGASLAGLHYVESEALGRTQEVLAQQLVEGLLAEQVVELQSRLAALLGGLATGFSQQAREVLLAEQEWIRGALTSALRQAREALRGAYEEVEQQVQERTAELRATNESLQREITERKRTEEALRISARQWHATFDAISDTVCLLDPEGRILRCNEAMAELLGKPFSEIIGHTCWELVHGAAEPIEGCPIARMRETCRRETLVLPRDDRWFNVSADPVLDEDGNLTGAVNIMTDITERRRAEEALRESEERYRSLFEGVPVGLYRVGPDGHFLDVNQVMLKMLDYPDRESLLAVPSVDLQVNVIPEDRQRRLALLQRDGPLPDLEVQLRRHDGDVIWARANFRAIRDAAGRTLYYEGSLEDITQRKRAEDALQKAHDELEVQVQERTAELAQANETLQAEIIERKRVEKHLLRTERLAAMGRLAAALAHEINNPLQAVSSSLELAMDFPLEREERQEYLQAARREIERLMGLTDRVLNFARPPQIEQQVISAADVVRYALALASKQLDYSHIRVKLDLPDVLPPVLASNSQLAQVFLNLMINAIEAMPDGGELSISARLAGGRVEVTFTDGGPGISPDAMARLFEPFYTTKENGTGLGLATSHSIIQQHGGIITASNAPGGGSVFTVALPIAPLDKPHLDG